MYVCTVAHQADMYYAVFPCLPPVALLTDGTTQKIIKIKKNPYTSVKRGIDLALPLSLQEKKEICFHAGILYHCRYVPLNNEQNVGSEKGCYNLLV